MPTHGRESFSGFGGAPIGLTTNGKTGLSQLSPILNKRLAFARLISLFDEEKADKQKQSRSELRHTHYELERGNPIRVYDGETLKLLRGFGAKEGEKPNG
ncbi:hypothetical protein FACS189468_6070 [Spirochaetia bacterium]|nr:hypothetical protein FACS189468_6070 [Spirochaetia bacterium]